MGRSDTADRGLGDQFNGVDNPPRHPCPLPDSKLCQALAGGQDFTARIPGIASTAQQQPAQLQCSNALYFVSSRNPSEQGRGLVFDTDPIAQSPADFARTPPAIQRPHLSAFREGFPRHRFTLCRITS
jgi:hypothetical protein